MQFSRSFESSKHLKNLMFTTRDQECAQLLKCQSQLFPQSKFKYVVHTNGSL